MDLFQANSNAEIDSTPVQHAVIVIHGIRDNGFWTKRVAREIKTLARVNSIAVRATTPSYGYFSMWDFIKPSGRERAVFWFLEQYADVRCHFPNAKISFVGHSNGTYIVARALEICPAITFENIVFAGSVVQRSFLWGYYSGRVKKVLNYVGSQDAVVAFLPAVFEYFKIRWLDVGGAGAFGFVEAQSTDSGSRVDLHSPDNSENMELTEIRFVPGGHGAAIEEGFWKEIAQFVLFGTAPTRTPSPRNNTIEYFFKWAPGITSVSFIILIIGLTLPITLAALSSWYSASHGLSITLTILSTITAVSLGSLISWLTGRFLLMW